MRRKITLKQIARDLQVSVSTVSKALKDSKEISKETKERIRAYAKENNYKPNNIALSLKNRRTKNIGVIIPEVVHYFFSTVIRGIEKCANANGYNVIICVSNEAYDKEVINLEMLANGSIDGFVMALSAETEERGDVSHLQEVINQGLPIVLFDRTSDQLDCDMVILDDEESAYKAVKKLIAYGNRKIGLVTNEKFFSVSRARADGYKRAIEESGIPFDASLVLRLSHLSMDDSPIEEFFRKHQLDAVLCVNETFAIRSMQVAQRQGLQVPEDISFIGFTDGILSQYAQPPLSTIDQKGEDMGAAAVQLLIDRLDSEEDYKSKTVVIASKLIERESIGVKTLV